MAIKEVPVVRIRDGTATLTGSLTANIIFSVPFNSIPRVVLTANYKPPFLSPGWTSNVTVTGFTINYNSAQNGITHWIALADA